MRRLLSSCAAAPGPPSGDRYGHLMPGAEDEAAALLDAYLARSDTAARLAQLQT
jgi:hypothetical protein